MHTGQGLNFQLHLTFLTDPESSPIRRCNPHTGVSILLGCFGEQTMLSNHVEESTARDCLCGILYVSPKPPHEPRNAADLFIQSPHSRDFIPGNQRALLKCRNSSVVGIIFSLLTFWQSQGARCDHPPDPYSPKSPLTSGPACHWRQCHLGRGSRQNSLTLEPAGPEGPDATIRQTRIRQNHHLPPDPLVIGGSVILAEEVAKTL